MVSHLLPRYHPLLALVISSVLLVVVPDLAVASVPVPKGPLIYHQGVLLTGNLELSLLWYGPFGRIQKNVVRSFIKSLNYNAGANLQPQVSTWWKVVESYQTAGRRGPAKAKAPPIRVTVAKQITDLNYSFGKVLTIDFIKPLVHKAAAAAGPRKTLVVIFTSRGVTVHGLCMGKCALHGDIDNQPYVVVGDPETECPGACAWPFHQADFGPRGVTVQPPNGNVGADSMVVALASGLAEAVTNPFKGGFYLGIPTRPFEAAGMCPHMFGSGAFPGYTGKVRVDPHNGGGFNAYGVQGKKFLLPAIWNPVTKACWTTM